MEGKKRTRSQTTLDKYLPVNFSQSPLKHARSALRHASPSTVNEPQPPDLPTDGKLKRPSSPANDPALFLERDPKRPRRDLFPPSAVRPTDDPPSVSSSPFRRAHSVPPISSTLPLLDLNNLPPSPRRSPAKFRIASVPPDPPPLHSLVLHPRPTPKPSISIVPHPPPSLSTPPSPLSPLSPLPSTDDERMPVDAAPVPTPSDLKPSRLPVPSVIAKIKPKLPTLTKKALSAHPTKQTSLAIRTTRSASLRQKKVQDEAKAKPPPTQGPSATPHRRRSMSLSSYAQPTAASAAKASPLKPASSAHPPSGPFTFTAAITPRLSHLVSAGSLNAVASSSKLPSESRVNASTTTLQLNSSLSTLNEALERLNAPPPSRPNTSMGFHRSAESDEDSDPERAALRSSTGASRRPASVLAGAPKPHSTAAKGKSKALAPATPAQTRTTETKARAALGRTQSQPQLQTQEKKMLRQTTLMLPPPLPAPGRVTQAKRDGGPGSVEEGERVDTAKAQASLALAPSLSKMRGSLGYALTPAGSASGCTPRLGVKAARSKQGQPAPAHRSSFEAALRGGPSAGAGMRGTGMRRTGALGSRVLQRVSKKSSLPVVIGSPVKGGVVHEDVIDAGEDEGAEESGERTTQERIARTRKSLKHMSLMVSRRRTFLVRLRMRRI
ncbi:hypothetical protein BC628DRAFT_120169 [Trametes gibbosa]|nr:hypothetical protein BC628DRAFT_120169 [Trametes gibbosa]